MSTKRSLLSLFALLVTACILHSVWYLIDNNSLLFTNISGASASKYIDGKEFQSTTRFINVNESVNEHTQSEVPRGIDAGVCVYPVPVPYRQSFSTSQTLRVKYSKNNIRCLPSFIIAGAMESGTGALTSWLNAHPNLEVGQLKYSEIFERPYISKAFGSARIPVLVRHGIELHYFSKNISKNHSNWLSYAKYFPVMTRKQAEATLTFEKSPTYMRSLSAMQRLHRLLPSVKLIVLLKNSVKRAISEINHHCSRSRYVKFTRDDIHKISINGVHYKKGDVVFREDRTHYKYMDKVIRPSYITTNDLDQAVDESFYEVLKHPCSPNDIDKYFFGNTTKGDMKESSTLPQEITNGFYLEQLQNILKV